MADPTPKNNFDKLSKLDQILNDVDVDGLRFTDGNVTKATHTIYKESPTEEQKKLNQINLAISVMYYQLMGGSHGDFLGYNGAVGLAVDIRLFEYFEPPAQRILSVICKKISNGTDLNTIILMLKDASKSIEKFKPEVDLQPSFAERYKQEGAERELLHLKQVFDELIAKFDGGENSSNSSK